jgi:DNA-binding transcriptional MerR regulator
MSDLLSAAQAADRLGVPKTTVVSWLRALPIEADTDSRGRYRLDSKALATLERIQALRGDGAGFETIREAIAPGSARSESKSDTSMPDLLTLLISERERSAALSERVAELSALAAAHQARASVLSEQILRLESGCQTRPWWQSILTWKN